MICGIFETVNTSAPYLENFVVTYVFAPLTSVTTAMTLATPMTTPSSVSTERSLFAHSDCSAIFTASLNSIVLSFLDSLRIPAGGLQSEVNLLSDTQLDGVLFGP